MTLLEGLDTRFLDPFAADFWIHLCVVLCCGAIVGLVLGMAMGWAITGFYTEALSIPDTSRGLYWSTPIIGMLFGVAVGLLAAWAPTRAAVPAASGGASGSGS